MPAFADSPAEVTRLHELRDIFLNHYRSTGQFRDDLLQNYAQASLEMAQASGPLGLHGHLEFAGAVRLTGEFEDATQLYQHVATEARKLGNNDLEFEGWIGVARSAQNIPDHGLAQSALQRAIAVAGATPTPVQRYKLADYAAQTAVNRGELPTALVSGLDALHSATSDADRFYAALNVGDVLQKYAERCDYQKVQDAKSHSEPDSWGGCRRAVDSATSYYQRAEHVAKTLQWTHLAREAASFASNLKLRLVLINGKAGMDQFQNADMFKARELRDVMVNQDFSAGASGLGDQNMLAAMITAVADDAAPDDPRANFLRGLKADIEGDGPGALAFFETAAEGLARERASFFDVRGRGTVVENRPELVRELGLRLLALQREEAAFAAFESLRAMELSKLRSAIAGQTLNAEVRALLAQLVGLESRASAARERLVANAIAGVELNDQDSAIAAIRALETEIRLLKSKDTTAALLQRFGSTEFHTVTLQALAKVAAEADTAVAFYWVTATNVLAWFVSKHGIEVKTVFLPEPALAAKVASVVKSLQTPDAPYAASEAEQLFTYLIKPFERHLSGNKLMVVAQGHLVDLPFEALRDPATDRYLVESTQVSYAPSATLAAEFLGEKRQTADDPAAVLYDPLVEQLTKEVAAIKATAGLEVATQSTANLNGADAIAYLSTRPVVHVLMHGIFDPDGDPLQSYLDLKNLRLRGEARRLTAAELLEVDWRSTRLAVFSACEGSRVTRRISNEIHGLSWAPLVGGARQVMLSRWRVDAATNSEWMAAFYGNLAKGTSTALAAAQAMRHMIDSEHHHPHYWAAPQLHGS